jgi:hypothetical protein
MKTLSPPSESRTDLYYYWSESCVTTDGQSASLPWNKVLIWGLRPDLDYCQTVAGLLMWDALSERTGLSFAIAAGPRQRSHFRVRVPWDSWPYFTVRFETSLFVASYGSQRYGGGIRFFSHKGSSPCPQTPPLVLRLQRNKSSRNPPALFLSALF